jgi:hypothetical protein
MLVDLFNDEESKEKAILSEFESNSSLNSKLFNKENI